MNISNIFPLGSKAPRIPCVYALINTGTAECYIGSTKNLHKRITEHFKQLRGKYHDSYLVQESYDKSPSAFLFVLVEIVGDLELRLDREQWWIDNTNSSLNICKNARSKKGVVATDKTRIKMAEAGLGRKASTETLTKLRTAQQNRAQETIEKTAAKHRGMKRSAKTRANMSAAKIGRPQDESWVQKRVAAVKKPVTQYNSDSTFIKEWDSAVDAGRALGILSTSITACTLGKVPKAGGFIWKKNIVEK